MILIATISVSDSFGQSVHPISTAFITPNTLEGTAELMFEEPVNEEFTIVIKDLTGHTVLTSKPESPVQECVQVSLNIENLKKGIYICQITGVNGKVKTLKFHKA